MLTLLLAYTSEDQKSAHQLTTDLGSHVTFEHVTVGRANEGPVLADLLKNHDGRLVLLVSEAFLTNPNCMLRGRDILADARDVLPVMLATRTYDELQDDAVVQQTSLASQSEIMHYVNHWQDRYISLRQANDLGQQDDEGYQRYRRKIRETSTQVEEVLQLLQQRWNITEAQLAANHYQQLFLFAERPQLWEEFKREEETPIDLSGIPGLEMLSNAAPKEEARPQVQGHPEGQSDPGLNPDSAPPHPRTPATMHPSSEAEDLAAAATTTEDQVTVWIERAWAMHDAGEADAGLELLNAGRDAMPANDKLDYHHALLLATATSDTVRAQHDLDRILNRNPDHPDSLYLSGELALAAKDHPKARDYWEHLSDLQPFYPELNYRLGTLLAEHFPEEYLDAAAYLRRATKDEDCGADAFYHYALLLAGPLERPKKAVKMLRRAISIDPNHAFAHYELAVLLHERRNFAAARNAFQLAKGLNPAFATTANERAFCGPATSSASGGDAPEDALSRLKQDIAALEAAIQEQRTAPAPSPAPAAAPPIGAGKTVFISGASSGIGRATARKLGALGFRLILLGRRIERLEAVADELSENHGTETFLLGVDISDRAAVSAIPERLPEVWQNIDFLINNAGKAKGVGPIHEGLLDHWDEMIDVNLKGLLYLTRTLLPGMVGRQSGMVVNVCSTAGKEVYPGGNVYCATKHAVDALTHAMRLDLVTHGVRVGQICPAMVEETEFSVVRFDGDTERAKIYEDFQPLRSPDVAEAIAFMITQPPHVNILDMVLQGTQQASSTVVNRTGRGRYAEEE